MTRGGAFGCLEIGFDGSYIAGAVRPQLMIVVKATYVRRQRMHTIVDACGNALRNEQHVVPHNHLLMIL